jgi:nitrogen fixation protein
MQRHTEIFQAKVVGKKDLEKPCIVIRTAILSCDEMVKLT